MPPQGYEPNVRFGSLCDISVVLADVCSWGISRHSIVARKSPLTAAADLF
jgi:hypothetical protein